MLNNSNLARLGAHVHDSKAAKTEAPRTATQQGDSPFPSHPEGREPQSLPNHRAKPAAVCRQVVLFGAFPSSSFGKHIARHQTPCWGLAVIDSGLFRIRNTVRTGLRDSPIATIRRPTSLAAGTETNTFVPRNRFCAPALFVGPRRFRSTD